jgi:hypothetical protein
MSDCRYYSSDNTNGGSFINTFLLAILLVCVFALGTTVSQMHKEILALRHHIAGVPAVHQSHP